MRRFALVAGAVAAAGLAGCGGDDRSGAVDAYIRQANTVQQTFAKDFKKANDTYLAYSKNEIKGDVAVTRLEEARDRIAEAEDRLAEIKPPDEAKGLHAKLLRVYDMNGDFAAETALLAEYLGAARALLTPLDQANRDLRRGLRKPGAKAQTRALRIFIGGLEDVIAELEALEVPRVLTPTHADQLKRLRITRNLSAKLLRALVAQDSGGLARALSRFRDSNTREPNTDLARQAIRQYDRRYKQLNEAYAEVQREQTRLEKDLG
jgi:hypothetical protein